MIERPCSARPWLLLVVVMHLHYLFPAITANSTSAAGVWLYHNVIFLLYSSFGYSCYNGSCSCIGHLVRLGFRPTTDQKTKSLFHPPLIARSTAFRMALSGLEICGGVTSHLKPNTSFPVSHQSNLNHLNPNQNSKAQSMIDFQVNEWDKSRLCSTTCLAVSERFLRLACSSIARRKTSKGSQKGGRAPSTTTLSRCGGARPCRQKGHTYAQ